MQEPPCRRRQLLVRRLAQQVVGEVVALVVHGEDAQAPQLVDGSDHRLGGQVARGAQQLEREVAAHGRGELDDGSAVGRQVVEAAPQQRGQVGRGGVQPSQLRITAHRLDQVQREAPCDVVEQPGLLGAGSGAELAQQVGAGGRAQRAQRELAHRGHGAGAAYPPLEGAVGGRVAAARGEQEQERATGLEAAQERQQVEGLQVAPLRVLQDQHHRSPRWTQGLGEPAEEVVAPPGVDHAAGVEPGGRTPATGQQPVDLLAPLGGQRLAPPLQRGLAQPLGDRCQGHRVETGVALGDRHAGTVGAGTVSQVGDQPGLADPGLAGDQHGAHATALDVVEGPPEPGPLLVAAHQSRWTCRRRCRSRPRSRPRSRWGLLRRRRLLVPAHEGVAQLAGGRVGRDPQLLLQHVGAVVVRAQRPGPVALRGLQAHQVAVRRLVERVQGDPAAGRPHGQVPALRGTGGHGQRAAQLAGAVDEARTLGQHPLVGEARQQVAAVRRQRALAVRQQGGRVARGVGEGVVARGQVLHQVDPDPDVGVAHPRQVGARHHHGVVGSGQPPQLVQLAAQVGQRLLLGRVGPERLGDPDPGLGGALVQCEVGDQRDRARRAGEHLAGHVVDGAALSEDPHAEHAYDSAPSRAPRRGIGRTGPRCAPEDP